VESAKALGDSFKLVTLAPKNCKGDDSTAQGNLKEWDIKTNQIAQINTQSTNLG